MTYVGIDGVVRHDQYPIHGDNWQHLGYEPIEPLPPSAIQRSPAREDRS